MRKNFIVAAALALATTLGGLSNIQAAPVVFKISVLTPDGSLLNESIKEAGKEIMRRTDGRASFKVYPGGVMGNSVVVQRKIKAGQLHGASFTAGDMSHIYSDFQIMSLPMLLSSYEEVDAVKKYVEPKLLEGCKAHGYQCSMLVDSGFAYMMSNAKVTSIPQLKGRKIWIPQDDPVSAITMESLNVPPVALPLTDVLTSLQTGMLDTVFTSSVGALILQWWTKISHILNFPLLYCYGSVSISQAALDRVSPEDQAIIMEELNKAMKKVDSANRKDADDALKTLAKQGIEIVELDAENAAIFRKQADIAIQKINQKTPFDQEMLKEIRAIIDNVRAQKAAK